MELTGMEAIKDLGLTGIGALVLWLAQKYGYPLIKSLIKNKKELDKLKIETSAKNQEEIAKIKVEAESNTADKMVTILTDMISVLDKKNAEGQKMMIVLERDLAALKENNRQKDEQISGLKTQLNKLREKYAKNYVLKKGGGKKNNDS